jgi:cephalosporin hydroxylase
MFAQEIYDLWWGRYVENYCHEMLNLVNIVEAIKPLTIIEIGVKHCGTLRLWERTVPPEEGMVIGVDMEDVEELIGESGRSVKPPQVLPGHGDPRTADFFIMCPSSWVNHEECTVDPFDPDKSTRQIRFAIGDSNSQDVHDQIASILGNRKADFIFHDGGHFGDVPQKDFDNIVQPFLRSGGLFALADIRSDGVLALYENLPIGLKPVELVPPDRAGIALWWKP